MKTLKAETAVPLYEQIYEDIARRIETGEYKAGDKIPTETELLEQYGVSRVTVRRAMSRLVSENLLVKKAGKGTFVSMPAFLEATQSEGSFSKSVLLRNAIPGTRILFKGVVRAERGAAEALGMERGDQMICLKRLRLVNEIPSIFEVDFFPMCFDFLLDVDLKNKSLLEVIREKTGKAGNKSDSYISVKLASREQAKSLECSAGTPLLGVDQTMMTEQKEILYYNEQYIRSDRYKYYVGS